MTLGATLAQVLKIKKMRLASAKRRLVVAANEEKRAMETWQIAAKDDQHYGEIADQFLSTAFADTYQNSKPHLFLSDIATGFHQSRQRADTFRQRAQHRAQNHADLKYIVDAQKQMIVNAEGRTDQFETLLKDLQTKQAAQVEQNVEDEIAELFTARTPDGV